MLCLLRGTLLTGLTTSRRKSWRNALGISQGMKDGLSGIASYLTWSPALPISPRHVSLHEPFARVLASSYNFVVVRRDPDSGNWREGHTDHCLYAEYIDHLRQVVLPLYRQQLEIEVEKFLNGCENPIGLNFLNQLPAIATSVFQNISPPPPGFIGGHTTGGTGNTKTAIPYAFDPAQLLDGLESQFQPADAFDFNSLNNGPCFEDSSYTSGLSDGFDATDGSSNTSADESSAKGQTLTGQQPLRLPEQFSQVPFDPNYYSYGLLGAGGYDYQP